MKRMFPMILLFALLLCVPVRADELTLDAPSALLMEKQTGTVLFAKDEHTPREPASVTKVMTLLLTMEAIDSGALSYDDTVTGSAHAASMGGSQIWLKEGEQMRVEDLIKAVCVVSGNDAAVALGEHLAGSEEAFVARMNERAKELGMNDTHFVNCTGLPADGHVTSAYDIALMSRELIWRHPDIRRFTTIWMDSLRGGASMLVNTNKLVRFYPGATGLKTGSTDSAKYCISATAEKDGMELIAVILGRQHERQALFRCQSAFELRLCGVLARHRHSRIAAARRARDARHAEDGAERSDERKRPASRKEPRKRPDAGRLAAREH
ncbi:MAG: D-alanyl-D-alanine carboxypeptidase family protein [Oscillospiraceae bacterium]